MRLLLWVLVPVLLALGCRSVVDLDADHAYPCSRDAGVDEADEALRQCPPEWRCGLEGRCHEVGVLADYVCAADEDCEGSWRCGFAGRCVDPERESLTVLQPAGAPQVSVLSPPHFDALPTHLAVSDEVDARAGEDGNCGWAYTATSWVDEANTLHKVVSYHRHRIREALLAGAQSLAEACAALALQPGARLHEERWQHPLPARVRATAEAGAHTAVLQEDGTLCTYDFVPEKGLSIGPCYPGVLGFVPHTLKSVETPLDSPSRHLLLAWSEQQVALLRYGPGAALQTHGPFSVPSATGGALTLHDVLLADGYDPAQPSIGVLYVATLEGLLAARPLYDGTLGAIGQGTPTHGVWTRVESTWDECNRTSLDRFIPRRLGLVSQYASREPRLWVGGSMAFNLDSPSYWEQDLTVLLDIAAGNTTGCPMAPTGRPAEFFVPKQEVCTGCAYGQTQAMHVGRTPEGDLASESRCGAADGQGTTPLQARYTQVSTDGETVCTSYASPGTAGAPLPLPFDGPQVVAAAGTQVRNALAAPGGHVWSGGPTAFARSALRLDRPPALIFGPAEALTVHTAALSHRGTERLGEQQFQLVEGQRLQPARITSATSTLTGTVAGAPNWVLFDTSSGDFPHGSYVADFLPGTSLGRRLVARAPGTGGLPGPFLSTLLRTSRGGTLLAVASADSLLSADVGRFMENPEAGIGVSGAQLESLPALEARLTPQSRAPITSLAALEPVASGGTPLAEGYLLAAGRVHRFEALNPSTWRTQDFVFGELEPVEVWADGAAARVGFRDGSVRSLPNGVTLAAPLPGVGERVLDYQPVCGQVFALGEQGGLHRLVLAPGERVGQWLPVALPGVQGLSTPAERAAARMYAEGQTLFLFTSRGDAYRLTQLECP